MSEILKAAIDYAEMGYRIFPCRPDGKEPATQHGCLDATTDIEQIERWWTSNPQYNVAIATDGLLVLDIDPAGKPWMAGIQHDELAKGTISTTPRGGHHYWFRQNGTELNNTAGKIHPGVDTRANGGYVLVPPSVVAGQPYRWVNDLEPEQPPIPAWLMELLAPGEHRPVREEVGEQIPEGNRNHAMYKIACYQRRMGCSEEEILEIVRTLNQTRCSPPLSETELARIASSAARYEPDFIEQALLLNHLHDDDDEEPTFEEPAVEFPQHCIDTMPGVMREAYDYVLATAIKPQPELTLGALVTLFGAAFGRKVKDNYDTRTNVMVLALAPSGAGKDHPRKCNKEFMLGSGMELVNGPERIGSHAGIISALSHHPVRLFQLDEIGRLLATMRDPKISHLYNVGTVLMALYSSSGTVWTGDAYADLNRVKRIDQPHVCVYGTSVPESLYSGLSPENLTDGLVGRLILFQSMGIPDRQKPIRRGALPWRVTQTLKMWADFDPPAPGNLASGNPTEAMKTDEAERRHEEYCDIVNSKHRTDDSIAAGVWVRAPEKAGKLALIYAACEAADTDNVTITLDAENWGIALANYSTRLVLQAARNTVSGSRYEADLKFVFNCIDGEVTQNQLTRRTQKLKRRQRDEILSDLVASGAIEAKLIDSGKRPKTVYKRRRNTL